MSGGQLRWQYPDLGSERLTDHTYSGLANGARHRASGACNSNNRLRIHASRLHVQRRLREELLVAEGRDDDLPELGRRSPAVATMAFEGRWHSRGIHGEVRKE